MVCIEEDPSRNIFTLEIKPYGFESRIRDVCFLVTSEVGGRWDVFFLPDEQPLIWYLQIGMFDPAAAVATYLSRVLYSDLGGRSCIFLI